MLTLYSYPPCSASPTTTATGSRSTIDASIYAFIANIYFYDRHALKQFVVAHDNRGRHG